MPMTAAATQVTATLTGFNGAGTFNDTLPCGSGDGPNWRYGWFDQTASSPDGVLGGTWDGTFEVHQAGGRVPTAFIPDGDGRIAITVPRGGTAHLETVGGGSCENATLALASDPSVSGTVAMIATGGSGAMRGLTGSGTLSIKRLELAAGAQNLADVSFAGDLDVADPAISAAGAWSHWQNLSAYLAKRLTVHVTLANAGGAGDAFDVRIAGASGGTFGGVPTGTQNIPAQSAASYAITMYGAQPGKTYTIGVTAAGRDGLLSPFSTPGSVTFKAASLP